MASKRQCNGDKIPLIWCQNAIETAVKFHATKQEILFKPTVLMYSEAIHIEISHWDCEPNKIY